MPTKAGSRAVGARSSVGAMDPCIVVRVSITAWGPCVIGVGNGAWDWTGGPSAGQPAEFWPICQIATEE